MGPIHKPTFLHLYLVHFMGQMCHLAMAGLVFETGADMWLLLCGLEGGLSREPESHLSFSNNRWADLVELSMQADRCLRAKDVSCSAVLM